MSRTRAFADASLHDMLCLCTFTRQRLHVDGAVAGLQAMVKANSRMHVQRNLSKMPAVVAVKFICMLLSSMVFKTFKTVASTHLLLLNACLWIHYPLDTSAAVQVQKGTEASKARNSQLTYKSQSVKEEKDNKSGFGIRKAVRTHTLETNDGGVSLVTRCASLDQKGGQRRHHKGRYIRISCLSP